MSKPLRILVIFLVVDALAVGAYFGVKAIGKGGGGDPAQAYDWVTMDAWYQPAAEVEQSVKDDYGERDLLPLQFRNYGRDTAVLRKFRGSKLVGAGTSVLEMTFKGLEDWAIVDLRIKSGDDREIRRTVLYVLAGNEWKVGDSGRLAD